MPLANRGIFEAHFLGCFSQDGFTNNLLFSVGNSNGCLHPACVVISSPNNATAQSPTTGSGPLVLPPACARKISSAVKAHSSMISTPPSWMENLRLGPGGPRLLLSWAKTRRLRSSGSQPTKMMLRAALRKSLEPRMRSSGRAAGRVGLADVADQRHRAVVAGGEVRQVVHHGAHVGGLVHVGVAFRGNFVWGRTPPATDGIRGGWPARPDGRRTMASAPGCRPFAA